MSDWEADWFEEHYVPTHFGGGRSGKTTNQKLEEEIERLKSEISCLKKQLKNQSLPNSQKKKR